MVTDEKAGSAYILFELMGEIKPEFVAEADPRRKRKSHVKKKALFPIMLAAALALGIPLSSLAVDMLLEVVQEKTQFAQLDMEETSGLSSELDEQQFGVEDVESLEPLRVNEHGQTYGPAAFSPDLVLVETDNGKEGYVYREQLDGEDVDNPREVEKEANNKEVLIAYASDGRTKVGTFTLRNGS